MKLNKKVVSNLVHDTLYDIERTSNTNVKVISKSGKQEVLSLNSEKLGLHCFTFENYVADTATSLVDGATIIAEEDDTYLGSEILTVSDKLTNYVKLGIIKINYRIKKRMKLPLS